MPLPVRHPDTGENLLYVGRFDMLAERNGALFGEDDKTASQLGASWVKQWDLDSQFTGYTWAMSQYGYNFAANNGDIIHATAVDGFGIAFLPEFLIEDDLASGALVPVLAPFTLPELPMHLVYPHRKHASAALRAFLDLIATEMAP